MQDKAKVIIIIGIIVVITIVCGVGYKKGYRLQNNLLVGKVGILHVDTPLPLTSVFIDTVKIVTTEKDNQNVTRTISPGTHTIISSRQGYYPWTKTIVMKSSGKINLAPIFVAQNTSGFIIRNFDSEYWKIRNKINADVLPTKEKPLVSKDGKTNVWTENNAVIAQATNKINSDIHTVIQPDTIIRNVSFYKDRADAVIFSTNNGVYVIETDTEGTQNFMPIYKGTNPVFIEPDPQYIYILDGETLLQVVI